MGGEMAAASFFKHFEQQIDSAERHPTSIWKREVQRVCDQIAAHLNDDDMTEDLLGNPLARLGIELSRALSIGRRDLWNEHFLQFQADAWQAVAEVARLPAGEISRCKAKLEHERWRDVERKALARVMVRDERIIEIQLRQIITAARVIDREALVIGTKPKDVELDAWRNAFTQIEKDSGDEP
jgi:hypothetical protein